MSTAAKIVERCLIPAFLYGSEILDITSQQQNAREYLGPSTKKDTEDARLHTKTSNTS